jgi:hypothetical protein
MRLVLSASYRYDCLCFSSIDYGRVCPVRPLGLWELDRTETDAEGCIFVQLLQKLSS